MLQSTLPVSIAFMLLAVIPVSAQTPEPEPALTEAQLSKIQMPMDQEEPVFTYDALGGFQRLAPTDDPTKQLPRLSVYPDGKIVTGGQDPRIQSCEMQISADELKRFLSFVVNDNRFYEIEESALKEKMKSAPLQSIIADAPTAKFSVDLQDGKHSVEIYALTFALQSHPTIEQLGQLMNIEKRCQRMIAKAHLGNEQQQNELLKSVNEKLKIDNLQLDPLSVDDVQWATRFRDGSYQVSFQRNDKVVDEKPTRAVHVRFFQKNPKSQPEVIITANGAKK